MRTSAKAVLATVAATGLLVVGVDYATYAATGDSLVLGHINKAGQPTVLTNTGAGPALKLNSGGPGAPALTVNSKAKVAKLNADMVDGKHAKALLQVKNVGHVFTTGESGGTGTVQFNVPTVAPGVYDASFSSNFAAQGSTAAPVKFSCFFVLNNNENLAQDTSTSTSNSGFHIGLNGNATIRLTNSDDLEVWCGGDGGAWTFGDRPLTATLTKLDGRTAANLPLATRSPHPAAKHIGSGD